MIESNKMSPYRRELMLTVLGDIPADKTIFNYLYHYDRLSLCDDVLKWLVMNRLTGKNFKGWIQENNFGILDSAKFIIKSITRDVTTRPILAGRDFKV